MRTETSLKMACARKEMPDFFLFGLNLYYINRLYKDEYLKF
ncbi:MAG: hypothetical protein JWM99_3425 [Verrucomicrobiales bacterium]|nr:hypothetical protein [Verrucomicrobiales bacterium]